MVLVLIPRLALFDTCGVVLCIKDLAHESTNIPARTGTETGTRKFLPGLDRDRDHKNIILSFPDPDALSFSSYYHFTELLRNFTHR